MWKAQEDKQMIRQLRDATQSQTSQHWRNMACTIGEGVLCATRSAEFSNLQCWEKSSVVPAVGRVFAHMFVCPFYSRDRTQFLFLPCPLLFFLL